MAGDLIEECISDLAAPGQDRDYKAFQDTFCLRCRNANCIHAKWVSDQFSARIATQPDRFFNPTFTDGRQPKYADLVDFADRFQEAMKLEIANKRGDWEVPEVPIVDGQVEQGAVSMTDTVDDAVRALAKSKGKKEPALPDARQASMDDFVTETEKLMAEENSHCEEEPPPASAPLREPPTAAPDGPYPMGNTPTPATGLMVGGGQVPSPDSTPATAPDDWSVKPVERKVQPGAVIRMGTPDPSEGGK